MSGEFVRATVLIVSVVLLGGTAIGVVRAALGLTPWSDLALPAFVCVLVVGFVVYALRSPSDPAA